MIQAVRELELLTLREAAGPLKCSPKQVRRLIDAGLLKAVRLGIGARSDRVHPADLEDYISRGRKFRPCQSASVPTATASKLPSAGKARPIAEVLATGRALRLVRSKQSS